MRWWLALLLCVGCDSQLAMSGDPSTKHSIMGCSQAVDHLKKCCPAYDSYVACNYTTSGSLFDRSADWSEDESKCLAAEPCDKFEKAITSKKSLCGVSFRSQRCK
jgi:hypothetical protein